jgi:alkylmercury lyase
MAPELEHVRNVGFGLIYETGQPVPLRTLAAASRLSTEETESRLSEIEEAGRARRNKDGSLVGIAGLSLEPTTHAIEIEGREFWTWCALDAVGIFTALGATGQVTSTPPGSKHSLEIEFTHGVTDTKTALFIAGGYNGRDVFASWCPNVNFFDTDEDATRWAKANGVEGDVVTIAEVSETAETIWASVVKGALSDTANDQVNQPGRTADTHRS